MQRRSQSADEPAAPAARRRTVVLMALRALATVLGLVVGYFKLPMDQPFSGGTAVALVLGLIGIALLLAWHARSIANSPHPRLRAVYALISTASVYLLLFAAVFYLMERSEAGSFSEQLTRMDALYFTLTVFTTVGFGDIVPRTETARVTVVVQMIGNLLLIGLAARFLLAAAQEGVRRRDADRTSPSGRGPADGDGPPAGKR